MSIYFERYAYLDKLIEINPSNNLGIVITIPCFNEPDLIKSLESIAYCHPCRVDVEVIVVINQSVLSDITIKNSNQRSYHDALEFASIHNSDHLTFHILFQELPEKHAGVGLARKIAMDEAARRLDEVGKPEGTIVCFDADSLCQVNYLLAINQFFDSYPMAPGCSIHFEHPLSGELERSNYQAIIDYELFLRYYVHALRFSGFPFAYQTIGSSMAVRNTVYQKQGGMNRRKAGEDFYFLHKIISLGNFGEIKNTMVIPSPRKSDRVPFGTGKAVNDWINKGGLDIYHPKTFQDLSKLYAKLNSVEYYNQLEHNILVGLPESIVEFGNSMGFIENIERIKSNSGNNDSFKSNFHRWFNGFKVLKYVHFTRDHFYPNLPIYEACSWLFKDHLKIEVPQSSKEMLLKLRAIDAS